jgi:hypothetical protein
MNKVRNLNSNFIINLIDLLFYRLYLEFKIEDILVNFFGLFAYHSGEYVLFDFGLYLLYLGVYESFLFEIK